MAPSRFILTMRCFSSLSWASRGLWCICQMKSSAVRSHESLRLILAPNSLRSYTVIMTIRFSWWFFWRWCHSLPSKSGADILGMMSGLSSIMDDGHFSFSSLKPLPASSITMISAFVSLNLNGNFGSPFSGPVYPRKLFMRYFPLYNSRSANECTNSAGLVFSGLPNICGCSTLGTISFNILASKRALPSRAFLWNPRCVFQFSL